MTFTPSKEQTGSYAFVNGIVLIPIPDLFGSALVVLVVGFTNQLVDVNTSSLQMMYQLHVGGQYVAPTNDTILRTWYDDTPYLYGGKCRGGDFGE